MIGGVRGHRVLHPLALVLLLSGCGSEETPDAAATGGGPVECTVGEVRREDGSCLAPGVPADLPCPPGELEVADGACVPAGVAPDDCAPGFAHDDFACHPIQPAAPCGAGTMAVPGETRCREVMPCGPPPWGDVETDATTQFVDAAYVGADSDGTAARPWTSIQLGVDNAAPSGRVVIAEGTYTENVVVDGAGVRVSGRCPSLVEIVGPAAGTATLELADADGAVVTGLSIRGAGPGVAVSGGEVTLDRLHIQDTAAHGVIIVGDLGETHAALTGSLVDSTRQVGVFVEGADALIEASVVRATKPQGASAAAGIVVQTEGKRAAALVVSGVSVEHNAGFGILGHGSIVSVDATVVVDTAPLSDGSFGRGVEVSAAPGGARSTLSITRSVLANNTQAGLRVEGSDAQVEATVVRDTRPDGDGALGRGIDLAASSAGGATAVLSRMLVSGNHDGGVVAISSNVTLLATRVRDTHGSSEWGGGVEVHTNAGAPSFADVRSCVIERSVGVGIHVRGSELSLDASAVRDTTLWIDEGRGVLVSSSPEDGLRGTATIRASVFERNAEVGVHILASDALLESITVADTQPSTAGEARGIAIEADLERLVRANATARSVFVERSATMGLYVGGADVTLESSALQDTSARSDGAFGDGVAILGSASIPSVVTLTNTVVSQSARASLSNFGSTVVFGDNDFACSGFDLEGEIFLDSPFAFDHRGGNRCGCPARTECQVLSSGLAPPPELPTTIGAR